MKGRAVPSYPAERIAAARATFEQHGDAMQAAAETLPRLVRLADGRKLRAASPMSGGLGYLGVDAFLIQVRQAMYAESARRPIDST